MSDEVKRIGEAHYRLNIDVIVEGGSPSSTGLHARIKSITKDTVWRGVLGQINKVKYRRTCMKTPKM